MKMKRKLFSNFSQNFNQLLSTFINIYVIYIQMAQLSFFPLWSSQFCWKRIIWINHFVWLFDLIDLIWILCKFRLCFEIIFKLFSNPRYVYSVCIHLLDLETKFSADLKKSKSEKNCTYIMFYNLTFIVHLNIINDPKSFQLWLNREQKSSCKRPAHRMLEIKALWMDFRFWYSSSYNLSFCNTLFRNIFSFEIQIKNGITPISKLLYFTILRI